MKKIFISPEIEILLFGCEDIVCSVSDADNIYVDEDSDLEQDG